MTASVPNGVTVVRAGEPSALAGSVNPATGFEPWSYASTSLAYGESPASAGGGTATATTTV